MAKLSGKEKEALQEWLNQSGLSRQDAAKLIGVPASRFSSFSNGTSAIKPDDWQKLFPYLEPYLESDPSYILQSLQEDGWVKMKPDSAEYLQLLSCIEKRGSVFVEEARKILGLLAGGVMPEALPPKEKLVIKTVQQPASAPVSSQVNKFISQRDVITMLIDSHRYDWSPNNRVGGEIFYSFSKIFGVEMHKYDIEENQDELSSESLASIPKRLWHPDEGPPKLQCFDGQYMNCIIGLSYIRIYRFPNGLLWPVDPDLLDQWQIEFLIRTTTGIKGSKELEAELKKIVPSDDLSWNPKGL